MSDKILNLIDVIIGFEGELDELHKKIDSVTSNSSLSELNDNLKAIDLSALSKLDELSSISEKLDKVSNLSGELDAKIRKLESFAIKVNLDSISNKSDEVIIEPVSPSISKYLLLGGLIGATSVLATVALLN